MEEENNTYLCNYYIDFYMSSILFFILLISVVALIVFGLWNKSPQRKGKRGERIIHDILLQLPQDYHVLDDVILKTKKGTTQIDHIVVSKYGLFTIETKNYQGDIYGDDNRNQWTQLIVSNVTYMKKWYKTYTYVTKNFFYNPVKQSLGHCYVIKKYLSEWPQLKVIPIVAFTGYANVINIKSNHHVVNASYLISTIQNYQTVYLSDLDVQNIIKRLLEKNVRGVITDRTHIQNVYATRHEKSQKVAAGICPNCGSTLVLRSGRYGKFYGCSNYPRCRFTTHYC